MTRKEAFLRNGEIAFKFTSTSLYYRHKETRWYEDYTKEQMNYLWKHKYIEWSKPMTDLGEYITDMYIQFTDSGTKWRQWYTFSHWEWIKYNVLGYMFWLYKVYYPIRKYVFRKPYPWEGYENVDLDNI